MMNHLSFDQEELIRHDLIIILLSAADKPIATRIKFQKEVFLLTRSFPKFEPMFQFIPYRFGPYSQNAEATLENHAEDFVEDKKGIYLSEYGKKSSPDILSRMKPENRSNLITVSKMINTICSALDDEELMFLIYTTYGYENNSDVYAELYNKREHLAKKLYNKQIISHQKYTELISES